MGFRVQAGVLIVHGDQNTRLQQADDLRGPGGFQHGTAAHGHKEYVDVPDFLDLGLAGHLAQIAQMTYNEAIKIKEIGDIALRMGRAAIFVIGGEAGDEDILHLVFPRPTDNLGIPRHPADRVVARLVMADRGCPKRDGLD